MPEHKEELAPLTGKQVLAAIRQQTKLRMVVAVEDPDDADLEMDAVCVPGPVGEDGFVVIEGFLFLAVPGESYSS